MIAFRRCHMLITERNRLFRLAVYEAIDTFFESNIIFMRNDVTVS